MNPGPVIQILFTGNLVMVWVYFLHAALAKAERQALIDDLAVAREQLAAAYERIAAQSYLLSVKSERPAN